MPVDGLLSNLIHVHDLWNWCRRDNRNLRGDFEAHDQQTQRLISCVFNEVLYTRTDVCKVAGAHGISMIAVMQTGIAGLNEVDFLFVVIGHTLTTSVRIKPNFAETRHTAKRT